MNILHTFLQRLGMAEPTYLNTPFGQIRLAKGIDKAKAKKLLAQVQRQAESMTRQDIAAWRRAWQAAVNPENPDRKKLYAIYRDVEVDAHLAGCVSQRQGLAKARSFKFVDKEGKENEEALVLFDTPWFKQLMQHVLDVPYWGHSLIELGDIVPATDTTPMQYDKVSLIPRAHVVPEYGVVLVDLGDDIKRGVPYREAPYAGSLVEAGSPTNLGLYLKAAPHTIPKKNALAFWDTFAEIFGMPMRVAKTSSRDETEKSSIERMMQTMGTEFWAVFPEGMEVDIVETNRGDAYNVYDRRIDRANGELSKLLIGQTMTIEDGSSLSQSQVHLEVFKNLVDADCDLLRDVINTQLLPRMTAHGFPVAGLRFEWDYSVDYTPEQQVAFESMVADRYEVDPTYFAEKYSMPVGQAKQAPTSNTDGSFFD